MNKKPEKSQILIYQTEDNRTKIEVELVDETVWLTQEKMAELFQKDKRTISEHIQNIFKEGELKPDSVVRNFRTTASDGKTYDTNYYNLDVIISVGYRVKSFRGTQFRIWATQQLREYIIKGFVMDDERLSGENTGYFEELLERVRRIRASERNLYEKVRDIFATSIDYNPKSDHAKTFYSTVQNKFHFAITGETAAEIITHRIDSKKQNMGLTNWKGDMIKKDDAIIAKNYMIEDELKKLYLLVEQFLSFSELRIALRKPMYMHDWQKKLDGCLKLNELEILEGTGGVSHKKMEGIVKKELEKFNDQRALPDKK